jgi:hypothetical protein
MGGEAGELSAQYQESFVRFDKIVDPQRMPAN